MSISQHEINYTPSQWSRRNGDSVELLANWNEFCEAVTENVRKTVKCKIDIPYDNTNRTKYDVYGTDLPDDAPIFVYIHGGYWLEGSKDIAAIPAPVFVAKGIKVITVGYELCPNVKLRNIVSQIKTAVEQILELASGLGSRGVWVAGHSAGAHLAASLLYDETWLDKIKERGYSCILKGVVLISGIYNLEPLLNTSFNDGLKLTKDETDAYSFNLLDTKNRQPVEGLKVIVAVGECDSPVFINESRECAQKLVTVVDNVEYVLLRENIDHFDIMERLVDAEFVLTNMILNKISCK